MQCEFCKNQNPDGSLFCAYCGNDLEKQKSNNNVFNDIIFCPKCNGKVEKGEVFCGSCGFSLKELQKNEQGIRCPKCDNKVEKDEAFCGNCGNNLNELHKVEQSLRCPDCNNKIEEGEAFCGNCGFKLHKLEGNLILNKKIEEVKEPITKIGEDEKEKSDKEKSSSFAILKEELTIEKTLETPSIEDAKKDKYLIEDKEAELTIEQSPEVTTNEDVEIEQKPAILNDERLKDSIPIIAKREESPKEQNATEVNKVGFTKKEIINANKRKEKYSLIVEQEYESKSYVENQLDSNDIILRKSKNKKKIVLTIVGFVIIIAAFTLYYISVIIPSREETEAWGYVKTMPTEEALVDFMTAYNGKHYKEAKTLLEDISDWNDAMSEKTISSIKEYIVHHPSGLNIKKAREIYSDLKESEDYEKKIVALNEKRDALDNILTKMYYAIDMDAFDANDFYAKNVTNYYGLKNIAPAKINEIYMQYKKEYRETNYKIAGGNEVTILDNNYGFYFNCILKCYRKSKGKYEYLETVNNVVFNSENKIISVEEEAVLKDEFNTSSY